MPVKQGSTEGGPETFVVVYGLKTVRRRSRKISLCEHFMAFEKNHDCRLLRDFEMTECLCLWRKCAYFIIKVEIIMVCGSLALLFRKTLSVRRHGGKIILKNPFQKSKNTTLDVFTYPSIFNMTCSQE